MPVPLRPLAALVLAAVVLTGCGGLFGSSALTEAEVAGVYEFRTYELQPTAGLDAYDFLDDDLPDDVAMTLQGGAVRVERLSGGIARDVLARGTYEIRDREVFVAFSDLGELEGLLMPRRIEFDGGGGRLETDVFLSGLDLEAISDDYRGISRADGRLSVELRRLDR